jgi:hypothetical protein
MSHKQLQVWLREREPEIPVAFLPHLLGELSCPAGADHLAELGEKVLVRALEQPGRNRSAAFHLLAADAFFTYACEAMATESNVQGGLKALLKRIGERFG